MALSVWFSLVTQGCGVGVEESEGFSTWGVGVAENLNDSDSGQTLCSPIVTVCATNVTLGNLSCLTFQQEMIMAIQKGGSALTCMPTLRGQSRSAASLGLITQTSLCECIRSGLVSLKFLFAHYGWHYRCSVTLASRQWMRVLMGARPLLRNSRHRTMIMPWKEPELTTLISEVGGSTNMQSMQARVLQYKA